MIDRAYGKFAFVCDFCGEKSEEEFDTFQDTLDAKKRIGWASRKYTAGWMDHCPECQE